jgi:hypothetical protein
MAILNIVGTHRGAAAIPKDRRRGWALNRRGRGLMELSGGAKGTNAEIACWNVGILGLVLGGAIRQRVAVIRGRAAMGIGSS